MSSPMDPHLPGGEAGLVLQVTRTDDQVVIRASGELDLASEPVFRACVARVLAQRGTHLVLDLGQVGFIDARGLAVLVAARNQAVAGRGSLRVTRSSRSVVRLLEITGLDRVFPPPSG